MCTILHSLHMSLTLFPHYYKLLNYSDYNNEMHIVSFKMKTVESQFEKHNFFCPFSLPFSYKQSHINTFNYKQLSAKCELYNVHAYKSEHVIQCNC